MHDRVRGLCAATDLMNHRSIAATLVVVAMVVVGATAAAKAGDASGSGGSAAAAGSEEAEGVFVYTIEHTVIGGSGSGGSEFGSFSGRSSVELNFPQLMRDRRSTAAADLDDSDTPTPQQRRTAAASAADDKRNAQAVKFEAFEFDTAQIEQIKQAAANGGYYRIRLVPKKGGAVTPSTAAVLNRAADQPISASIRACQLLASNFRELWTFQSDVYGHITSVDYTTPITACPESITSLKPKSGAVTARGKISFGRSGEKYASHNQPHRSLL